MILGFLEKIWLADILRVVDTLHFGLLLTFGTVFAKIDCDSRALSPKGFPSRRAWIWLWVHQSAAESSASPDRHRVIFLSRSSSVGAPFVELNLILSVSAFCLCLGILKPDFLTSPCGLHLGPRKRFTTGLGYGAVDGVWCFSTPWCWSPTWCNVGISDDCELQGQWKYSETG